VADTLVLCYHAVSESWPASLSATPEHFDAQLQTLRDRGYRGVTFLEAATATADDDRVAVTFDDGFRSVLEVAFPALQLVGWPGTLFVPTEHVGKPGPMAWDGIDQWIGGEHERELHALRWDEIRELAAAGWEIGSHTRTHPRLTQLGDEELAEELRGSRERCEAELDRPVPTLAYPYGDVDARVADAAGEAGYTAAAALPKRMHPASSLLWPRVGIWHRDSGWRFRIKVSPLVRAVRTRLGR
jgi:peptidoglycan/xylan/chitin deacetylase (PgdA/CDA1 family)